MPVPSPRARERFTVAVPDRNATMPRWFCNRSKGDESELLARLRDGRSRIRAAHFAVCPGCMTYVEQLRQTVAVLGETATDALTDEVRADLERAFTGYRQPARRPRHRGKGSTGRVEM